MLAFVHFRCDHIRSYILIDITVAVPLQIVFHTTMAIVNILNFGFLAGFAIVFNSVLTVSHEFDTHYCDDEECLETTVVCEEDSFCQFYCGLYECSNSILNGYYAESFSLISSDYYGIDSTTIYGPYDEKNGINKANVTLTCDHEGSCQDSDIYFQFSNTTRIICSEEMSCRNNNISINYVDYFLFECENERRGCTYMNWKLNEINLAWLYIDGGYGSKYEIANTNLLFFICGFYYYYSSFYGGCQESTIKIENVCVGGIAFSDADDDYCRNIVLEVRNVDIMYVTTSTWDCICNSFNYFDAATRIEIDSSTLYDTSENMITLEEIYNCSNYESGILTVNKYNPYSWSFNDTYTSIYQACAHDLTDLSNINLTNLSIIPYSPTTNNNNNKNNNNMTTLQIVGIIAILAANIWVACCWNKMFSCLSLCAKSCGNKAFQCFENNTRNSSSTNTKSGIEQNIWDHNTHSQLRKTFQFYVLFPLVIFQLTLFGEDFFAFYNYDQNEFSERAFAWIVIGYALACGFINLFALLMLSGNKRENFVTFFSIISEVVQAAGFWYITGKKYMWIFGTILIAQIS